MPPTSDTIQKGERTGPHKLDVDIKRPSKAAGRLWWTAGILLALLFLAAAMYAYFKRGINQ